MYGVVLWSDTEDQKAVIWCEDHGDLAFYRQPRDGQSVMLDAGDWIQFDMTMERHLRYAHNPRLVADGVFPDLADAVGEAGQAQRQDRSDPPKIMSRPKAVRGSAEIIPFSLRAAQNAPDYVHAHVTGA